MSNLLDPITRHAQSAPDTVALRTDAGDWTYARLRDECLRYAAVLRESGVMEGSRVLLAVPAVPEFVVAYMGVQALGAIAVTVNTMSTAEELEYYLADSGAGLAIGWRGLGAVPEAAGRVGTPYLPLGRLPGAARAHAAPMLAAPVDRGDADTAALLYTSGTTGRPKGARLGVGGLLAAGRIASRLSRSGATDRVGTALPLFHVFGQASVMMSAFTAGASLSLLARFTGEGMLALLARDRLTVMVGVPTMWNAMLHCAEDTAGGADFSGLRLAVSGGAALPGAIARDFAARFGCTILEGYGLTETCAQGTFNDIARGGKTGSAGAPARELEMSIRGADGAACPAGAVGEILIKGPIVMQGYWHRPEATAEAFTGDGWFRTGDLGLLDDDGDLHIVDRLKDLIVRGGYNVYPGEVEEVLYRHPDVVEAAVVGVPDEHYGEEVAALVVVRPGAVLTPDEVSRWCREHLSAYKIPRIVQFADALPKGATGKILKRGIDREALRKTPAV